MRVERTELDQGRRAIREKILAMGADARRTLRDTVDAFDRLDLEQARKIIEDDAHFNRLNESIHADCLALIARQQPLATDLREIITDLQIAQELERIADHAADIARITVQLQSDAVTPVRTELLAMTDCCEEMLAAMLTAFNDRDPVKAEAAAVMDDRLDGLNGAIVDIIIGSMQTRGEAVTGGTRVIWLAHNLERIGDRVTNIGEHILFAVSGKTADWNRSM